jgi:RNA polymerase sigma factor (TIGR02999 family)
VTPLHLPSFAPLCGDGLRGILKAWTGVYQNAHLRCAGRRSAGTPLPDSWLSILLVPVSDVTRILEAVERGDPTAAEELLPLVYDELRRLAAAKMANEPPGQTLQPTALVHEAWLRLSQESRTTWKSREQFYAMAAEVMRRILVDRARRRRSRKHGGGLERVDLDAVELPVPADDALVLDVHEALEQLTAEDPEKAAVVKLRFFVGLENSEVAALLGVSEKTVQRRWAFAKAWLFRAMRRGV